MHRSFAALRMTGLPYGSHMHRGWFAGNQLAQDELQDADVGVVLGLLWSIDSDQRTELGGLAAGRGANFHLSSRPELSNQFADAGNLEDFFPGQVERLGSFSGEKLQGQNAHAYQVGAVDAFVAF